MKFNRKTIILLAFVALVILILPAIYNVIASGFLQGKNQEESISSGNRENGEPASASVNMQTPRVTRESISNQNQQSSTSIGANGQNVSQVVETSQKYIGVPYVPGGVSPTGFDSSGFIQYVFNQHGISLPRSTGDLFNVGTTVKDLVPGDLVFFNTSGTGVSHVGIYIGNGRFISTTVNKGVKVDHLEDSYWAPKYMGAKRL